MQTRHLPMVAIALALSAFLSLLAVILTPPSRAPATFRGKNGRIAYAAPRGIFTMRPNGSDPKPLITLTPRVMAWGISVGAPDFSPNGNRVAFVGPYPKTFTDPDPHFRYQVFTARPDGSHERQITHFPYLGRILFNVASPEFSPNGKRISFTHCARQCATFIMRADGTAKSRVTRGQDAAWFPGGGRIAFERLSGSIPYLKYAIFTMRTNGRQLRRLTHDKKSILLDISPNGRKILFFKDKDKRHRLYVMRPNGSHRRSLKWKSRRWFPYEASFSPNGKKIAVGMNSASFKSAIFVMRANGSHPRRLTPRVRVDGPSMDWGPKR